MSLLLIAGLLYAAAFLVLFIYPQLLHKPPHHRICQRMVAGNNVKIVPHRGGLFENYENSLKAFAHCKRMGAFGVELDVHRTKDGQMIVCHDKHLLRITGQKELVSELNYSEIGLYLDEIHPVYTDTTFKKVNDEKERPPLFEDVLKLLKDSDIFVNVDVKSNQVIDIVDTCKLIAKHGYHDRAIIGCNNEVKTKQVLQSLGMDLPVFFNVREVFKLLLGIIFLVLPFLSFKAEHMGVTGVFESMKRDANHGASAVVRFGVRFTSLFNPIIPLVNWHMRRRGIPVTYWTLNTENDFRSAIRLGACCIMTDRPTLLREFLAREKLL
jgi:glycerophosphoryl diester phosphodiesterase